MQPTSPPAPIARTVANAAWQYALKVYARPGVSNACLLLQDELELDVLVMLHLAYVSCTQKAANISQVDVQMAEACVHEWRTSVVRPLRLARRAIDKNDDTLRELRVLVQKAELDAERQGLKRLAALQLPMTSASWQANELGGIFPVVEFYARRSGRQALLARPDVVRAIELLNSELFA